MDSCDDEDLFDCSDDDPIPGPSARHNPIEENLMNQLNEVQDQIRRAKSETVETETLTDKILQQFYRKCRFVEDESSGSDSELYDESGVPVAKRKCKRKTPPCQPLDIGEVWQRVIDEKWVIGINLVNNSKQILTEPDLYISLKGQDTLSGVTSFWEKQNETQWIRTEHLPANSERIVTTVVLDLPSFQDSSVAEVFGTIRYVLDGKDLQAPIQIFQLEASQAVHKSLTPKYATNQEDSILAIMATSFEKTFAISLIGVSGVGEKLLSFLEQKEFIEIIPDIFMSKSSESFRYCLIEIVIPEAQNEVQLCIFSRSTSLQNAVKHMLLDEFPEMTEIDQDGINLDAAIALEREIELRLGCTDTQKILAARVATDLFIP